MAREQALEKPSRHGAAGREGMGMGEGEGEGEGGIENEVSSFERSEYFTRCYEYVNEYE